MELLNLLSDGAIIGMGLASLVSIYVMARVIHFSYHFYIDHGIILVGGSNRRVEIGNTLRKLGNKNGDSVFAIGYPFAAIICFIFVALFGVIGHFWYVFVPVSLVVSFVLLPVFGIRIAAWNKRKKAVFMQKLDGTYFDKPS